MAEKFIKSKKEFNKSTSDVLLIVEKKIDFYKDVIQKTIIFVQKNKNFDILGINDINTCIEKLGELSKKIQEIMNETKSTTDIINNLQFINNELSTVLKKYGTERLEDLLLICFGNNNKITNNEQENEKLELLKKYFHPTSYKVIINEDINKNDKNDKNDYKFFNLSCSDLVTTNNTFHMKVYGIKLSVYSVQLKKSLLITGLVDDIIIDFFNNKYITDKINKIKENIPQDLELNSVSFNKFLSCLTLKDYLIYENNDIYSKFAGTISQTNLLKQKQVSQVVRDFITDNMYNKRNTLISLLVCSSNYENQYLAYLLYDLLSNEMNGNVDTQEQTVLFDSLPWSIKQLFKQAMKKTVEYTNELSNFDINKIPLEQQICLLKAPDIVKEKAMLKLKEVKAKSEDSGSKARQYLDGLLKIPFGTYKREPILNIMENIKSTFKDMHKKFNIEKIFPDIKSKDKYTSIEIIKHINKVKGYNCSENKSEILEKIKHHLSIGDKNKLIDNNKTLDKILKKYNKKRTKYSNLNKEGLYSRAIDIIDAYVQEETEEHKNIIDDIIIAFNENVNVNNKLDNNIKNYINKINSNMKIITDYMLEVKTTLDKAVHGHDKAKKQIERIIGQWINGEQSGYCFGFEGAPGIGKTSLAKRGIADCLKDDNGNSRPFAMIQMGGDSNGSSLHGHNYTYVGSTWGSIVQILIDKKCMNPIIFIDEVDKISRTEHGKEIVGILTHLLDPAQNDCFQDKYFTGINLDLSKALFILSYNDADAIDKILLDRVHRIKFNNLSLEDKLVISNVHILPEVYKKMGLEDMIVFDEDVLKFIIDEYTFESGVRKLKEILFEIVGEINLDILKNNSEEYELPIKITIDDIKNKYFKDKREIIIRKVPKQNLVGYANGMFATAIGTGGTLPIHARFFPTEHFLELKLTGLQQDVMKESMHVALTVAWNLTSENNKKHIRTLYDGLNNKYGINIHPGDNSVQKDGPSAGGIITIVLYSLLNNIPIRAEFAMTGEIQLSGDITAIGGLSNKIIGSLKAGVKEFIYPKENNKDFQEFYEKYKDDIRLKDIKFYEVDHVEQAIELILDK